MQTQRFFFCWTTIHTLFSSNFFLIIFFPFHRLRPGDAIVRNYDKEGDKIANTTTRIDPVLSKYVHAVIFVLKGNDPCLMDGNYRDKLQTLREHLNKEGNKCIYPATGAIHVTALLLIRTLMSYTPNADTVIFHMM